jgi:hypothetical protein
MRRRLIIVCALLVALVAVGYAATQVAHLRRQTPAPIQVSLAPARAAYLGVYEDGSPPSIAPVLNFGHLVGNMPNIVGWFAGWAQPFNLAFAQQTAAHKCIPFVQIDPTYASVAGIAAGDYDAYLRSYADAVRDFGQAVIIGFGHEMNAPWYSWGYGHVPAATFVAAWQHIVTLFRAEGTDNVTWLWTVNQDRSNTGPISDWWPGAQYVTWVGIDGYYFGPDDDFSTVFAPTINEVRALTNKPILLSETAVGPASGQFAKIANLFAGMRTYRTLGLVWFDKDQDNGLYHQDWRIEGDEAAEAAFRLGISALTLVKS